MTCLYSEESMAGPFLVLLFSSTKLRTLLFLRLVDREDSG